MLPQSDSKDKDIVYKEIFKEDSGGHWIFKKIAPIRTFSHVKNI